VQTARSSLGRSTPPAPAPLVARELELVEERLAGLLHSREGRLTEIANYLIGSGGKRVRPAVALLIFRACGGVAVADAVDVAVALELIHSASLLHDDIIDASAKRRGRDSALRKFGLADTLVTGDFLFSRAFQLCGRFDERLINWAIDACVSLTEGEIMQSRFRHNPAVAFADYVEIVERKTASLFQQGARTAATLAQAPPDLVEDVAQCALHVGITFQMIDDLLDVSGTEDVIGKPVGLDVREGNPSLPVVLAVADDPEARRLFAKSDLTDGEFDTLLARLRRPAIINEAHRLAMEHADRARTALRRIPESPYRQHLLDLVDQLVDRPA